MARTLAATLALAFALTLASLCSAKITSVGVLRSTARPFYSASNGSPLTFPNYSLFYLHSSPIGHQNAHWDSQLTLASNFYGNHHESGNGLLAFFQSDGMTTIVDSYQHFNYSVEIDKSHQGTAYAIAGATSKSIRLIAVAGSQTFQLICQASSGSCAASLPVVPIPVSDSNAIRTIVPVNGYEGLFLMASVDNLIVFSTQSMRVVNYYSWSSKQWMSLYGMDSASIQQFQEYGSNVVQVYVVLANERSGFQRPGMVLSFSFQPDTSSLRLFTTTLTDSSPSNMHLTQDRGIFYWTQTNVTMQQAYVLSRGGAPSPPALIKLNGNLTLSPSCMGEYAKTQVGILSASSPLFGQTNIGLKLGYGLQVPEVSVTSIQTSDPQLGAIRLAQQPYKTSPVMMGFVTLPGGYYALEEFTFGDVPTPQDSVFSRADTSLVTVSSLPKYNHHKSRFAANCTPSNCGFDTSSDCPQDHCWGIGSSGQFLCCQRPPI